MRTRAKLRARTRKPAESCHESTAARPELAAARARVEVLRMLVRTAMAMAAAARMKRRDHGRWRSSLMNHAAMMVHWSERMPLQASSMPRVPEARVTRWPRRVAGILKEWRRVTTAEALAGMRNRVRDCSRAEGHGTEVRRKAAAPEKCRIHDELPMWPAARSEAATVAAARARLTKRHSGLASLMRRVAATNRPRTVHAGRRGAGRVAGGRSRQRREKR
jgi:hypothetical protein